MAGNTNYNDVFATGYRKIRYRSRLYDAVTEENALLGVLRRQGQVEFMESVGGGRKLVTSVRYPGQGTFTRFRGGDSLNIQPAPGVTSAEYSLSMYATSFQINLEEELANGGDEQMFSLWGRSSDERRG